MSIAIPIFDSLTHPTIHSNWLNPKYAGKTINQLLEDMEQNHIQHAFAVDMGKNIGQHTHEDYFNFIKDASEKLIPVAYLDFPAGITEKQLESTLVNIKSIGYQCIKIHPRLAAIDYKHPLLYQAFQIAAKLDLIVFFCTFSFDISSLILNRTVYLLSHLINCCDQTKLVLLHGGTTQLLTFSEMIRSLQPKQRILLDLSWTICKYQGSSLDLDIDYLFKNFDRKICIGTDHPEFTHSELRQRFNQFSEYTSESKLNNIAHRNLENLLWDT